MKILIADDHEIVRTGLKQLMESHKSVEKVFEAADGEKVLQLIGEYKTELDMVVLDISMPKLSGLDVLIRIREQKHEMKVLILSMYPEKEYAVRVLKNGADGYITKDSAADELHDAIDTVLRGEKYVSKNLQKILLDKYTGSSTESPHDKLSDREFNVFIQLAKGKNLQEIAEQLNINHKTVSTYKSRLMSKLKLKTVTELTRYAIQNKLIE